MRRPPGAAASPPWSVVHRCSGCGAPAPPPPQPPTACPRATDGDDVDHLLARHLVIDRGAEETARTIFARPDRHPFARYRELLGSYGAARAAGLGDAAYVALAEELDRAVERVAGAGFRETPLVAAPKLARRTGVAAVAVKDETGNVAGSHKGRHLFGALLWREVARRAQGGDGEGGDGAGGDGGGRLAIASCGNAALAAAVVARAGGRPLSVFVPPDAHPRVLERLRELGADVESCPRDGRAGDPCYRAFRAATAGGAAPFGVQGPDHAAAVEGGMTLGWEMVSRLAADGGRLDRLFVQVGGGALATAVGRAFREAVELGVLATAPRLHAVQTAAAWPLARAWQRVVGRVTGGEDGEDAEPPAPRRAAERAAAAAARPAAERAEALDWAATHRSAVMRPWPSEPRSLASGILDDETYDWRAVVGEMIAGGGFPVVVGEERLAEARRLGREATGIRADATGTAGLAGLLELAEAGLVARTERVGVLFTGTER